MSHDTLLCRLLMSKVRSEEWVSPHTTSTHSKSRYLPPETAQTCLTLQDKPPSVFFRQKKYHLEVTVCFAQALLDAHKDELADAVSEVLDRRAAGDLDFKCRNPCAAATGTSA